MGTSVPLGGDGSASSDTADGGSRGGTVNITDLFFVSFLFSAREFTIIIKKERTYDVVGVHIDDGAVVWWKTDTGSVTVEGSKPNMGLSSSGKNHSGEDSSKLHFVYLPIDKMRRLAGERREPWKGLGLYISVSEIVETPLFVIFSHRSLFQERTHVDRVDWKSEYTDYGDFQMKTHISLKSSRWKSPSTLVSISDYKAGGIDHNW